MKNDLYLDKKNYLLLLEKQKTYISGKEEEITRLEQKITRLEEGIEKMKALNKELKDIISSKDIELGKILNSKSWKLTKTARDFSRIIKKGKKGVD